MNKLRESKSEEFVIRGEWQMLLSSGRREENGGRRLMEWGGSVLKLTGTDMKGNIIFEG